MTENKKNIPSHIPDSLQEVFSRHRHPYLMWDGIENIPLAVEEVLSPSSMDAIRAAAQASRDCQELHLIGCGTSFFAAIAGSYAFHTLAKTPAVALQAFEYLAYPPPLSEEIVLVGISHTGTTPVVLDAVDRHNQIAGITIGITDEVNSFLAQSSKFVISGKLGKEPALPKTRSFIATLLRLYLLAVEIARLKQTLDSTLITGLSHLPALLKKFITENLAPVQELSASIPPDQKIVITSGGPNFATAMEGALKLVEAAQIHAQAWEIEEAAHGTWASTNPGDWIIMLASKGPSLEKTKSIFKGLRAIEVKTWVVTDCPEDFSDADFITSIPDILPEVFSPLLIVIPLYLFTYQMAIAKGIHPDIMRLDDPRYLQARTIMRPAKK